MLKTARPTLLSRILSFSMLFLMREWGRVLAALLLAGLVCLPGGAKTALAASAAAAGSHGSAPHLDGAALDLYWVVPFIGILLSIAILPLVAPHFWHRHFGKVSGFWALSFLVPFALIYGWEVALYEGLHTVLLEYIPFIILLLALFTVAGGVRVKGHLAGTPLINTGILAFGTLIASWMGTTGAAMLLIRPIMQSNIDRKHNVHVIVFFIFLVANVGGSLTPLGDPPLFLGFLQGVDFFWPTVHMALPMLMVSVILLAFFYLMDSYFYRWERAGADMVSAPAANSVPTGAKEEKFGIEGGQNILLLGGVICAVLLSGFWDSGVTLTLYHVEMELQNIVRDLLLLGLAVLSWQLTSIESRRRNGFSWFPILEVGKLFIGIFLAMIPAIAILRAGTGGALEPVVSLVSSPAGEPVNIFYFWLTGILSSFLDNAPTYLVFFNTAGGNAETLMGPLSGTLLAISAGAVFMGANTYIGNAPNFMVRAIAVERGIKMPSFFGYMVWSSLILLPVFALVSWVFFA